MVCGTCMVSRDVCGFKVVEVFVGSQNVEEAGLVPLVYNVFFFFKYKHTHTAENSLSASIIIDDRMPLAAGGMVCGPHNVGHGYRYRVWWWCTGLITGLHWRKSIQPFSHLSFLTRSPLVPLSCGRGIRPSEEEIGGFPLYFFSACWSVAPFAGHWGLSPCPHILFIIFFFRKSNLNSPRTICMYNILSVV